MLAFQALKPGMIPRNKPTSLELALSSALHALVRHQSVVVMTRFGPVRTGPVTEAPDDGKADHGGPSTDVPARQRKLHTKQQPSPDTVKPFSEIPGPKGLPLIGTLHLFFIKDGIKFEKLFEVQRQRAEEFGDIYLEKLAGLRNVMISCPYEYNKVIRAEAKHPTKFMLDPIIYYKKRRGIKMGLITSEGEEWYKVRSLATKKMLVLSEVAKFADEMNEVTNDFVDRLDTQRDSNGEVANLKRELQTWAMESLGVFLFNERLGCLSNTPPPMALSFREHFGELICKLQQLMFGLPLYKLYHTKTYKKFETHADVVFNAALEVVDKKLEEVERDSGTGSDFLTFLMSNGGLDRKEIASVAVDVLIAGIETTSTSVSWNLYALAKNPRAQGEMYKEIREAREKAGGQQLNAQQISELTYVKAVVKETMRAFPIIPATSRFLFTDLELCGYHVPKGSHVQANLYGMYCSPHLFERPDQFLPERWLKSADHHVRDPVVKSLPQLTWGHGPRMCIGRRIAEQEMYRVLTKIVDRYTLSYHHEDVDQVLTLVIAPDRPVLIRFTPRT